MICELLQVNIIMMKILMALHINTVIVKLLEAIKQKI